MDGTAVIQKKSAPTARRKRVKWRVCKLCKRLCVYKIGKRVLKSSIHCVWFTSGLQIWCAGRDALKVNWLTPELWHALFPVDLLEGATVQISDTWNSQQSWIVGYFLYWKFAPRSNVMLVTISGGAGSRRKAHSKLQPLKGWNPSFLLPLPSRRRGSRPLVSCRVCRGVTFTTTSSPLVHHSCLY